MESDRAKLREQLMKYKKEEIISAILDQFGYIDIADELLSSLPAIRREALFEAEKKAMERESEAYEKYSSWLSSLRKKYSPEGGGIKINDLSDADLKKTREVTEEYENAVKARNEAMKKVDQSYEDSEKTFRTTYCFLRRSHNEVRR